MTDRAWRVQNVPVPVSHAVGLGIGGGLQLVRPWPIAADAGGAVALGSLLVGFGAAVIVWSVSAVGRVPIDDPTSLVTVGPYRYSRNPMYVGWTVCYLGIAGLANTLWLVALAGPIGLAVHRAVRREERDLERRFGDDYRAYARTVRRYF